MSHSDEDLLEPFSTTQMPVTLCITDELNALDHQRNILTQHFMKSTCVSSPASSAIICAKDDAVSLSNGAPTIPSTAVPPSDIMEQIQAKERRNHALERIHGITTLLKNISLSVPETRLAIYFRESDNQSMVKSSSIVHTEQQADGTDVHCVAQSPEDVDHIMEIHFKTPPQHSRITNLRCQIVYDPGSDNCVLLNRTEGLIYMVKFEQSYSYGLVAPNIPYPIQSGLWGIAVTLSDNVVDDCVVKFLLCERRHTISVVRPSSMGDLQLDVKNTIATTNNPLLDLQDGEIANIQAPLPNTTFRQGFPVYQLERISKISRRGFASVFSCQHSSVQGSLAVKVIQYESEHSASQLVYCSELWKREKSFLEKLKHGNIVSLKAFDGRVFALHLELLPDSLAQGRYSPFRPSDASKILTTVTSALTYLEVKGIVHNDLKPSNIAYSYGRGAVLFDFGIASSTNEAKLSGSPWYIPPELMETSRRNSAGDLWAFGIIMLYVLKKIQYPECLKKSWSVLNIREKASKAEGQMQVWLDFIKDVRNGLDRRNPMEYVTFRMLDEDQHRRITAARIQKRLKYLQ